MQPGPRNAITDVSGLRVGHAQDSALKSGVTVLTAERPFTASVHVMGGAPGTRDTDALAPDRLVSEVDALVLAGGSAFGLGAADGVMAGLRAMGRGFPVGDQRVPIVPAAILFDLLNGGDKTWIKTPYPALGAAALAATGDDVPEGSVGAGTGGTTATLKGGIGSASLILPSGISVGALVAVNALGSVIVGDGPHFWAAPFEIDGEFGDRGPAPTPPPLHAATMPKAPGEATTIGIVATDARLSKAQCSRMAVTAHDGFARAIVPSHTLLDGDLIFAAATGDKPLGDPVVDQMQIGHAAAICVARAIARGVHAATASWGDTKPTWVERFAAGSQAQSNPAP